MTIILVLTFSIRLDPCGLRKIETYFLSTEMPKEYVSVVSSGNYHPDKWLPSLGLPHGLNTMFCGNLEA